MGNKDHHIGTCVSQLRDIHYRYGWNEVMVWTALRKLLDDVQ